LHLRDANGWGLQLPAPHIAVAELVPLIPATAYRPISVREHTAWCFTLAVRIPGLGQVRLVVSFEQESLTGRYVVLVTHRVDWRVAKSIRLSSHRGPTDTFYQDGKGHLGVNEYRMRSIEAIGQHWCLVCVASSLLPLTCLPPGSERTRGLIHPMGDAWRQQGRAVLPRLSVFGHDQRSQGAPVDQVFARLWARQRGMVPA
jgi:hypothetical protein